MSEKRKAAFKKGLFGSKNEAGQARKKKLQGIRKEKRTKAFELKRFRNEDGQAAFGAEHQEDSAACTQAFLSSISELQAAASPEAALAAARAARRALGAAGGDGVAAGAAAAALPALRALLAPGADPALRREGAWCFANLAGGASALAQIALAAAGELIGFLAPEADGDPELQEQACWALGNLAGDAPETRAALHAAGAAAPVGALLLRAGPAGGPVARTAAWALSNLARGGEASPVDALVAGRGQGEGEGAPPAFAAALVQLLGHPDPGVAVEVAWALTFLTAREGGGGGGGGGGGPQGPQGPLLGAGLAGALAGAFAACGGRDPLGTPVARALGNLLSGPEEWTEQVLEQPGFLDALVSSLSLEASQNGTAVREAAWAAANLCAHHSRRPQLAHSRLTGALAALAKGGAVDLRREACVGLYNMVSDKHPDFLQHVMNFDILSAFLELLKVPDNDIIRCSLMFITVVLQEYPNGALLVESLGGIELIDDIHYSSQMETEIAAYAGHLIDEFYGEEYDDSNSPNVVGHSSTNNVLTGIDFTAIGNANHISSLPPPPPGAGRGRGMVQPAWMTQQQQQQGH